MGKHNWWKDSKFNKILIIFVALILIPIGTYAFASAPDAVTDLSLTVISDSQVDLNWTTPSDGGFTITGYKIEKKTIGAGTLVLETSFGDATTISYSDMTVSAGDRVTYRIFAINVY